MPGDTDPVRRQIAAAVPDCNAGLVVRDGRVVDSAYLSEMDGFAAHAQTTGGLGQPLFRVTRTEDRLGDPQPGSLRHAVEAARIAGGGYILFDLGAGAAPIVLRAPLRPTANITLDGGCHGPQLVDASAGSAIYLDGVENIVLTGFSLTQRGYEQREEGGDCITVRGGSDRVWISRMAFSQCRDGMVDITARPDDGITRVTIADSDFSDHDKVMLVSAAQRGGQACDDPATRAQLQVSLLRNRFVRVAQRIPRVSGDAFVHFYGNDLAFAPRPRASGEWSGSYGSLALDGGRILAERNRYRSAAPGRRLRGLEAQAGAGDCRAHGAVRAIGNDLGPGLSQETALSAQIAPGAYFLKERRPAWGEGALPPGPPRP